MGTVLIIWLLVTVGLAALRRRRGRGLHRGAGLLSFCPGEARLLLLSLLLVGCLPAPAPLVKVGLLAPLEGERREIGYRLLSAREGMPATISGRPVEWVILDTGSDGEVAARRARELIADPAVIAVIGPLLPDEVAAVAPLMAGAGLAWWPLAPNGEQGLAAWRGAAPLPAWGATQWPAIRRGTVDCYLDPALPADGSAGERWPQEWLAWQATTQVATTLAAAPTLTRAAVAAQAEPMAIPPATRYCTTERAFPGQPSP